VDALLRTVDEPHVHVAEIVLRELAWETLEAHQRPHQLRAQRRDERVQRALPARVPVEPGPPQDLQREQIGLAAENPGDELAEPLHRRRPTDAPSLALGRIVRAQHLRLRVDLAVNRSPRLVEIARPRGAPDFGLRRMGHGGMCAHARAALPPLGTSSSCPAVAGRSTLYANSDGAFRREGAPARKEHA
jgi:hypothetical protein